MSVVLDDAVEEVDASIARLTGGRPVESAVGEVANSVDES